MAAAWFDRSPFEPRCFARVARHRLTALSHRPSPGRWSYLQLGLPKGPARLRLARPVERVDLGDRSENEHNLSPAQARSPKTCGKKPELDSREASAGLSSVHACLSHRRSYTLVSVLTAGKMSRARPNDHDVQSIPQHTSNPPFRRVRRNFRRIQESRPRSFSLSLPLPTLLLRLNNEAWPVDNESGRSGRP